MDHYHHIVNDFKVRHGIQKIIAFSGGADVNLSGVSSDNPLHKQYSAIISKLFENIIEDCIAKLVNMDIAILTGGTKWGVPYYALKKAKEYGFKTIGVYPEMGGKHACHDLLDLDICVPSMYGDSYWGDESSVFCKLLDADVVIGGGSGTLIECMHILKANETIHSRNQKSKSNTPLKYIIPISGTGGTADSLHFVSAKKEILSESMPEEKVQSGLRAADILIETLNLYDYFNYERRSTTCITEPLTQGL